MSDVKLTKTERREMQSRMGSIITFIPNFLKLLYRLMRDSRVSKTDKAVLAATMIYVISPFDFIPDFFPFIGQVDDLYMVAIAVLRLINRSTQEVVQQHWDGGNDIKSFVTTITNLSQFFLPKKVRNLLVGRLDQSSNIADFETYSKKRNPEPQQR
jgi:uncharacterized membrane protein YkvA (DUF1232 family)